MTLANLFCGVLGIVEASKGNLQSASYLIWIAAVFDFFDGFAARMLKVSSPIGKELDSLADMVTFGVLPSIIIYELAFPFVGEWAIISFSISLFSALRLAKFNIDDRQLEQFIGLPTPASAFFVSALPFIKNNQKYDLDFLISGPALLILSIILSLLMVIKMPLFSLKFKDFKWENNMIRYIFVFASASLVVFLNIVAIPVIIILYLVMSLIDLKTSK